MMDSSRLPGRWYLQNGKLNEGIHVFESIIKPNSKDILWLGILHLKQGRARIAEGYLGDALAMSEKAGDLQVESACLCMLSRVNTDRGDFSSAMDLVIKAQETSAQGEYRSKALAFHALAYCLRISRDFEGSARAYKCAIEILHEAGDSRRMNEEIRNLATVMFLNGEIGESEKLLRSIRGSFSKRGPYFEAYTHVDEAIISFIEGGFEKSQRYIMKARSAIEDCEQILDPDEEMILVYLSNSFPR